MGAECLNGDKNDIEIYSENTEKSSNYQSNNLEYPQKFIHNNKPKFNEINYKNYSPSTYKTENNNNCNNYLCGESTFHTLRANSLQLIDEGRQKNIKKFSREELNEQINDILRIRIPFFENTFLKALSSFTFLSGNGPYHEGLMFFTTNKKFYIAQSYPITFIKVYDFYAGISEIISYNNINNDARKYYISEIYSPQEPITLHDVLQIINTLPNKYNLLNDNCQNFCNNILEVLCYNFRMEIEDKPNKTKIDFLKNQQIKIPKNPKYKVIQTNKIID